MVLKGYLFFLLPVSVLLVVILAHPYMKIINFQRSS